MPTKLTAEIVAAMRIERRRGMTYPAMAQMAGVHTHTVMDAVRGTTWWSGVAVEPVLDDVSYRGGHRGVRRFTPEQVREIRRRWREGETQTELAREFGISKPGMSRLVAGRTYAEVEGDDDD